MCVDYITGSGSYTASPMMENPIFKRLIGAAATFTRWVGDASRTISLIFIKLTTLPLLTLLSRTISLIFICGVVLTMLQALMWSFAIRKFAVTLVNVTITAAIGTPC
jgi:hypothetical protein